MAKSAGQSSSLFRKVALEKALTPEHPNTSLQVVTPMGWLALLAIIGILAAVVVWSILGTLPTKVHASGILVKTDAVIDVVSHSEGTVTDISVRPGELVRAGQVVARVSQPEILEDLVLAKERLDKIEAREARLTELAMQKRELNKASFAKQQEFLVAEIALAEERISFLERKLERNLKLAEKGFVTRVSLEELELDLIEARDNLQDRQAELESLVAEEAEAERLIIKEEFELEREIADALANITSLKEKLHIKTRVVANYTGKILELKVDDGDSVQSGLAVLSLERVGPDVREIQVIAYVSALEAKRLQPGMTMLVSPSNVKKEEHGLLYAKVEDIAAFPATPEGMQRTLRNRNLVDDLSAEGAATQVSGDLVPDARTFSEYRWTSRKGPPIRLQSGTLCTVSITVEEQRPIKLLLPTVRRYLGV